jgi:hypothetical protein
MNKTSVEAEAQDFFNQNNTSQDGKKNGNEESKDNIERKSS